VSLTQRQRDEVAAHAVEHAEFMARIREDQLPKNLNPAQLRGRIQSAQMDMTSHQESIDYHQGRLEQRQDEIEDLRAELRGRDGKHDDD
jgi:hypothetical protein